MSRSNSNYSQNVSQILDIRMSNIKQFDISHLNVEHHSELNVRLFDVGLSNVKCQINTNIGLKLFNMCAMAGQGQSQMEVKMKVKVKFKVKVKLKLEVKVNVIVRWKSMSR